MEGMPCEGNLDMPCEAAEAGLRHLLDLAFLGQEKIWGAWRLASDSGAAWGISHGDACNWRWSATLDISVSSSM